MVQTSILVVDDERGPRESLNAFLSDLGHAVVTAEDAPSAIKEIAGHSFDIIITDKNMPGFRSSSTPPRTHRKPR